MIYPEPYSIYLNETIGPKSYPFIVNFIENLKLYMQSHAPHPAHPILSDFRMKLIRGIP